MKLTYGYKEHWRRYGDGENALRTNHCCQPGALRKGDRLATGEYIARAPSTGFNGDVYIYLADKPDAWVQDQVELVVPSRIPLALIPKSQRTKTTDFLKRNGRK